MKLRNLIIFFLLPFSLFAEEKFDYKPKLHGVFRGRYELETADGVSRFQVRNARLSVSGNVAPIIDYYVQFDACEKGKMRFLDAWGRLAFTKEFNVQVGQFRKPFGVDAFRGPAAQYFANRSFIAKQVGNIRGVGVKLTYNPASIPWTFEGGVFNTGAIENQEAYTKGVSYSARVFYKIGNVRLEGGWQTLEPEIARINMASGAMQWNYDRWHVELEYMYKHYMHLSHPDCHAYNSLVAYKIPVKVGVFNHASFLARFDGMTDHSNGTTAEGDALSVTDPARNRLSVGGTLTYKYKIIHADIRLNYEKYFYHSGYAPTEGNRDKIVAELVVKF